MDSLVATEAVARFNRLINELIAKLIGLFPEHSDVMDVLRAQVSLVQSMGGPVLLSMFADWSEQHADLLRAHDDSMITDGTMPLVATISPMWQSLDTESRDAIWSYIDTLVALCQVYRRACPRTEESPPANINSSMADSIALLASNMGLDQSSLAQIDADEVKNAVKTVGCAVGDEAGFMAFVSEQLSAIKAKLG
jgi:hypothetical protein